MENFFSWLTVILWEHQIKVETNANFAIIPSIWSGQIDKLRSEIGKMKEFYWLMVAVVSSAILSDLYRTSGYQFLEFSGIEPNPSCETSKAVSSADITVSRIY